MLRRPAPAARFLVDPAPHSRVVPARRDRLSNAEKEPVLKGLLGCSAVVAGESEDGLRAPCRMENKTNGVRAKSDPGQARRRLKQARARCCRYTHPFEHAQRCAPLLVVRQVAAASVAPVFLAGVRVYRGLRPAREVVLDADRAAVVVRLCITYKQKK